MNYNKKELTMRKIIIDNKMEGLTDTEALQYVQAVIQDRRISNDGKQYCYLTVFKHKDTSIAVGTFINKESDRFLIVEDFPLSNNGDIDNE